MSADTSTGAGRGFYLPEEGRADRRFTAGERMLISPDGHSARMMVVWSVNPYGAEAMGAVPDVIAVPRADLGRKLAAARARDLLTNASNALRASASTLRVDRSDWITRASEKPFVDAPWAKTRNTATAPAKSFEPFHLTGGVASVGADKRDQWVSLEAELQVERAALDEALNSRLDPHRIAARNYAQIFRKCIIESDPKRLYDLLKGVGANTPFCPTDSAPAAKDEALETALNQDLALHVAATRASNSGVDGSTCRNGCSSRTCQSS